MSYLHKITTIVLLSFILLFSFSSLTLASENPLVDMITNFPKNNPWSLANEFCQKRSGELMNLETWYSGKCSKETYTLSGEGVGFVDIIQLQALEWIFTPQHSPLIEQITELFNTLSELKKALEGNNQSASPSENNRVILNTKLYNEKLAEIQSLEINQGLIPKLGQVIQKTITTKPASSTEYIAYVSRNLKDKNIINNVYAAETGGFGFNALSPILPLWRAFRNIAYMLFAVAFVLYGIMIMFRVNIDSKTAATFQLAIPKLVTTLLMITFSYAIVGLLVDISTVMGGILIDTLRVGGLLDDTFTNHVLIKTVSGNLFGSVGSFLVNFFSSLIVSPFIIFNLLIGGIMGAALSTVGIMASLITGLGIIFTVIIFLAVGFSYIKLIIKLFQSYFTVIISLIFSPIILLGNVFPGSKAFSGWIMNLVGNLAVFPAASFLLTLSYILIVQPLLSIQLGSGESGQALLGVKKLSELSVIWSPPLTLPSQLATNTIAPNPVMGSVSGSLMLATVGIGLLLMASQYVDMILKAFSVPPFPYGAAIGDALKYGSGKAGQMNPDRIPNLIPIPNKDLREGRESLKTWAVGQAASWGGTKKENEKSTI